MENNRRRHPRHAVQQVEGTMTSASRVEVTNMSLSGIAIYLDKSLRIGREYTIRVQLNQKILAVTGEVVWCTLSKIRKRQAGEDTPMYSAGLKFTDSMTPKQRDLLQFLDEHWAGGEKRLGGIRFRIEAPGAVFLEVPQRYAVRLISMTGALIRIDRELVVGEKYPMEIVLSNDEKIKFAGRVASCQVAPNRAPREFEIGIAFEEMIPADERRLKGFLASLKD